MNTQVISLVLGTCLAACLPAQDLRLELSATHDSIAAEVRGARPESLVVVVFGLGGARLPLPGGHRLDVAPDLVTPCAIAERGAGASFAVRIPPEVERDFPFLAQAISVRADLPIDDPAAISLSEVRTATVPLQAP